MTDQSPRPDIVKGEMPVPRYFQVEEWPGSGLRKRIGIEGYSVDGEVKTFILLQNLQLPGDYDTPEGRNYAASALTGFKLEFGADAAIAQGVSFKNSDAITGKIETFKQPNVVGIYVEKDKRFVLGRVNEVDRESPEWLNYHQKALNALPRPAQGRPPKT